MKSLSFIEIDVPFCTRVYGVAPCTASIPTTGDIKCFNSRATCQDIANFLAADVTWRFAKPATYLPTDIDVVAASIIDISFTPATISLGENLGTRATLQVVFKDHPHSDTGEGFDKYLADRDYDPYSQGTFWGKFRARQPFLRGRSIRWITGLLGDALADMETRHFFIDSFDGPTPDGRYTIVAKDLLKFADGDRAQAPPLSNGFLLSDIDSSTTSATLSPSGIGNAEYPAAGYAALGGKEVVLFTRSGDALTITRAQKGSTAASHKGQDRVQLVLDFTGADAGNILWNLLTTYAGIDPSYIDLPEWNAETAAFLGNVYTGNICEPTSVATLCAEIIKQAGLSVWWDDINQQLRLKVLRGIVTDVATFTPQNYVEKSLTIREQPERRISRCQVYFGPVDPTKPLSNLDNFRSTSVVIDEEAETEYGSVVVETIVSRWIAQLGRSVADRLAAIRLGRFRDPPRRLQFQTWRYAETDVEFGTGYRIESQSVQDATGAQSHVPIQVTRLNPGPDRFTVEAEEMLFTVPDADLLNRIVIIDANNYNINLRSAHDSIYPTPVSGDEVTFVINTGVIVGSGNASLPAIDVGSWPAGVTLNMTNRGRMQGRGGMGGAGGLYNSANPASPTAGSPGLPGGPALYARYPINLDNSNGYIWSGGGGGGGGGGGVLSGSNGGGGGGGAGEGGGLGGLGVAPAAIGSTGTNAAGGDRGQSNSDYSGHGGDGGDPGASGVAGDAAPSVGFGGVGAAGGAGGASGLSIDGISYITMTGGSGSILGTTAN